MGGVELGIVYVLKNYFGCWVKKRLEGRLGLIQSSFDWGRWISKQEVYSFLEIKEGFLYIVLSFFQDIVFEF